MLLSEVRSRKSEWTIRRRDPYRARRFAFDRQRTRLRLRRSDGTGRVGIQAEAVWDAGDTGCGELLLELRARVAGLRPGQVFELIAHDLGAPADIPAWCRLTGHTLVSQEHPVYRIRRKES